MMAPGAATVRSYDSRAVRNDEDRARPDHGPQLHGQRLTLGLRHHHGGASPWLLRRAH